MSLVETVTKALTGSGSGDSDDSSFEYRCVDCGTQFAEPRDRMVRVNCPDCGSVNVRIDD